MSGLRWAPLYCKDTGDGTKFYLYDCDSTDADTYSPIALLHSDGDYSADDPIVVTIGDGILANDSWGGTEAQIGAALYCYPIPGYTSYTAPSSPGDHVKQIGTLLNINANGRDVWEISFRYPDAVVPTP